MLESADSGGKYVDELGIDITGLWISGATIHAAAKGIGFADFCCPSDYLDRTAVRVNVIRKKTGWFWTKAVADINSLQVTGVPLNELDRLISVEIGRKHLYCAMAYFACPLLLDKKERPTEPRLRPLAYHVEWTPSRIIGEINLRGRVHPVYECLHFV